MIVLETKLKGTDEQYGRLDEAIRTSQFVRNSCIRYWMDNRDVGKGDLSKLCAQLAASFEWANSLNSMARQASAERAWQSINRFYSNCKKQGKRDTLGSRKTHARSSTKHRGGSYRMTASQSHSPMDSQQVCSRCGALVTSTSTKYLKSSECG